MLDGFVKIPSYRSPTNDYNLGLHIQRKYHLKYFPNSIKEMYKPALIDKREKKYSLKTN